VYSKKSLKPPRKEETWMQFTKKEAEIKLQLLNFNGIIIILCNAFSLPS